MTAVNDYHAALKKPLVVLLQGPVGPFFRELQHSLIVRGFDTIKINFCGGDYLFSDSRGRWNFRGTPSEWSAWLKSFIEKHQPAAIVLFGDSRPYHIAALKAAREHDVIVWCLEEGYIRPNYITCELNGNNARSSLRLAETKPGRGQIKEQTGKASFWPMARCAMVHRLAQAMLGTSFRGNVPHRDRPIVAEGLRWALSFARKVTSYPANRRVLRDVASGKLRSYYVVALQVHDDLNLARHGNGWTMHRLINDATRSFARYSPPDSQLLFKVHPLDRGHLPYRKLVADAARAYGCEARTRIVDDGPIGLMIRHCDGVVTVNSTSGLLALRHGKPLLALGNAVYSSLQSHPTIATADLDSFWMDPRVAHPKSVRAFLARMVEDSLIEGDFYRPAVRAATADAVADTVQHEFICKRLTAIKSIRCRFYNEADHERMAR